MKKCFFSYSIIAKGFLSLFGIGFSPIFPGTAGSLVSAYFLVLFSHVLPENTLTRIVLWIILFFIVFYTALPCISQLRVKEKYDHSYIVIDEFLGMMIAALPLLLFPQFLDIFSLGVGFFAFRFFDMVKPLEIKKIDNTQTPFSVLFDDVVAGGYALVIVILFLLWRNENFFLV